jgi:hypothetical protein
MTMDEAAVGWAKPTGRANARPVDVPTIVSCTDVWQESRRFDTVVALNDDREVHTGWREAMYYWISGIAIIIIAITVLDIEWRAQWMNTNLFNLLKELQSLNKNIEQSNQYLMHIRDRLKP